MRLNVSRRYQSADDVLGVGCTFLCCEREDGFPHAKVEARA